MTCLQRRSILGNENDEAGVQYSVHNPTGYTEKFDFRFPSISFHFSLSAFMGIILEVKKKFRF